MSDGPSKTISARSTTEELRARMGVRSAGVDAPRPLGRRIIDGIKTFLWVAPLTVLIWVYAERSQQVTMQDVPAVIEVKPSSNDRIVTVLNSGPDANRIYLDLEGPNASLSSVRDRLSDPGTTPLTITLGDEFAPDFEGEVPILDRLAKDDLFTKNAITVKRARPPVLRIRIDRKMTRMAKVVPAPDWKALGEATFDPPMVKVEGPQKVLALLKPEQLVAYADLSQFANKSPGTYGPQEVPITFVDHGANISVPKHVQAKVAIRSFEKKSITMAIRYLLPSPLLDNLNKRITPERPTIPGVEVVGPPDAIQLMQPTADATPKFEPYVIIKIDMNDLTKTDVTKRLTPDDVVVPPGVTVTGLGLDILHLTITDRP